MPALEPLVLAGDFHPPLSGIAHEAAMRISRKGEKAIDLRGSLLWTHFGISGPLALNASRFFRRAMAEGATADLSLSFVPDLQAEVVERHLIAAVRDRPHHQIATEVSRAFVVPLVATASMINANCCIRRMLMPRCMRIGFELIEIVLLVVEAALATVFSRNVRECLRKTLFLAHSEFVHD